MGGLGGPEVAELFGAVGDLVHGLIGRGRGNELVGADWFYL